MKKVLFALLVIAIFGYAIYDYTIGEVRTFQYRFTIEVNGERFFTDDTPTITETGISFLARDGKLKVFNGYPYHVDVWLDGEEPEPEHD
jgi:hypothetical protein